MNKVLETTRFVVANADFIHIDRNKIDEFSRNFERKKATHWLSTAPFDLHSLKSDEERLRFLFILSAFSFFYWEEPKWTVDDKNKKLDGWWGVMAAMGRALEDDIPLLDPEYCSVIPREQFAHIFRGDGVIPLLDERWLMLQEIGNSLLRLFDGKVLNLIDASGRDALKLIDLIVTHFPSFEDDSFYKGQRVFFRKRAQLFVSEISKIFSDKAWGRLSGMNQLAACADYKLPRALRKMGILKYVISLAQRVDKKEELLHGSQEEVEIRALTVWAVECMKETLQKRFPDILSMEINDHLWLATQTKFQDEKPYHRTRTTAY